MCHFRAQMSYLKTVFHAVVAVLGPLVKTESNAIGHAMVAFFLPRSTFLQTWASDGQVDGLYVHGTTIYSCLLMTMNYKVGLETRWVASTCGRGCQDVCGALCSCMVRAWWLGSGRSGTTLAVADCEPCTSGICMSIGD